MEASGPRAGIFHFTGHMQHSAARLAKSVFILNAFLMPGESRREFAVWKCGPGLSGTDHAFLFCCSKKGDKESQDRSPVSARFGCDSQGQRDPEHHCRVQGWGWESSELCSQPSSSVTKMPDHLCPSPLSQALAFKGNKWHDINSREFLPLTVWLTLSLEVTPVSHK